MNFEYYSGRNAIRRRYLPGEEGTTELNIDEHYEQKVGVFCSIVFCFVIIVACILGLLYVDAYAHYMDPTVFRTVF